mmetsp:Transcript_125792/g.242429  ORF Transcript_125792/g.242429 Transcript_125792/m.242429 type:complete len:283 (-) Transcript_125792:222-1070(-)
MPSRLVTHVPATCIVCIQLRHVKPAATCSHWQEGASQQNAKSKEQDLQNAQPSARLIFCEDLRSHPSDHMTTSTEQRPQNTRENANKCDGQELPRLEISSCIRKLHEARVQELPSEAILHAFGKEGSDGTAEESPPGKSVRPKRRDLLEAEEYSTHGRTEGCCNPHCSPNGHKLALRTVSCKPPRHAKTPSTQAKTSSGDSARDDRAQVSNKWPLGAGKETCTGDEEQSKSSRKPSFERQETGKVVPIEVSLGVWDAARRCSRRNIEHQQSGNECCKESIPK